MTVTNGDKDRRQRDDRLVRVPEAADRLGLKEKTLRFWIWAGKIEFVKVGGAIRLRQSTIEKIIERGLVPAKR